MLRSQFYKKAHFITLCSHRQFIHYPHWKSFMCKLSTRFFLKNPARWKQNDDNKKDNVLSMTNSQYLEYMYKAWMKDPNSVSFSWDSYFKLIHSNVNPTSFSKDTKSKNVKPNSSVCASSSLNLMISHLNETQSNSEFDLPDQFRSHCRSRLIFNIGIRAKINRIAVFKRVSANEIGQSDAR